MASWLDSAEFESESPVKETPTGNSDWLANAEFDSGDVSHETPQVDLLANPEQSLSLRDYASGRGSQFLSAIAGAGSGLLESAYDYTPPGMMYRLTGREMNKPGIEPMREFSADMQGAAEFLKPKHPALKWMTDVVDGITQMAPSVVTSMITKSPNAGLSVMGGQVFGQTYNEEVANGASPDEAAIKAMRSTAYELGPEKIFGFFDRIGVTGGVKKYLTQVVAEAASEFVTEALTINDETVIQGEEFKGWVDFLKRTGYAASIGAGMGAGLSLSSLQRDRTPEQQEDVPPPSGLAEELELDKIAERVLAENLIEPEVVQAEEQLPVIEPDLPAPPMTEEIPVEDAGEQLQAEELPIPPQQPTQVEVPTPSPQPEPVQETEYEPEPVLPEPTNEPIPAPTAESDIQPRQSTKKTTVPTVERTKSVNREQTPLSKDKDGNWIEFDSRMQREDYRAPLLAMTSELIEGGGMGIVQLGGKKRADGSTKQEYEDTVRLPSQNPQWFQGIASEVGISVKQLKQSVKKALSGNVKLGVRQEQAIRTMLDIIQDERTGTDAIYGPAYDSWRDMLSKRKTERDAAKQDAEKEFGNYDEWLPEYADESVDLYNEAYEEYANEYADITASEDSGSGQDGREGGKKSTIRPSSETQESLPIEGAKDSDRLHNLKEQKEAERKGLAKPYVAPEKGAGGLFQKEDTFEPGQADTRKQIDIEDKVNSEEEPIYDPGELVSRQNIDRYKAPLTTNMKPADLPQSFNQAGLSGFKAMVEWISSLFGNQIAGMKFDIDKDGTKIIYVQPRKSLSYELDQYAVKIMIKKGQSSVNLGKDTVNISQEEYSSAPGIDIKLARKDGKAINRVTKVEFGSNNKLFKKPTMPGPGELQDITSLIAKAAQYAGFMVEGGIRDFATFSKEMVASFGDKIKPYLKDLFADAMAKVTAGRKTQPGPTSNKEEQVDRERAARGKAPVGKPERPDVDEMNEQALADLKNDDTLGPSLISDILSDPNPKINDEQNALMAMYRRKVMNARDSWAKKAEKGDIEAKRSYDEQEAELERIDRAAALTRAQWGRWGVIQQQMIAQDYSREVMERKARVAAVGPLNQTKIKQIKDLSENIADKQKKLEESEEQRDDNVVNIESSKLYQEVRKRVEQSLKSGNRKRKIAEAKKTFTEEMNALNSMFNANPLFNPEQWGHFLKATRAAIQIVGLEFAEFAAHMRSNFNEKLNKNISDELLQQMLSEVLFEIDIEEQMLLKKQKAAAKKKAKKPETVDKVKEKIVKKKQDVDQAPKELIPVKPDEVVIEIEALQEAGDPIDQRLIVKLVLAHILDGVHGENAVMAAVTADIQEFYPEVTERDVRLAFTQYGKRSYPSSEEHQKEMREIKTLVRLQESIDRLKADDAPEKTGFQRDKATQKIRERQKVLNILMREYAKKHPDSKENAAKLASVEQTRITRLENRIKDLEKMIATGERPGPKVEVDDSPEVSKLKAKIEVLKEELKRIDEAKNPPISPEEKQLNELGELRNHLDTVLRNREAAKTQKPFSPLTKEAADLKQEIDELRKMIAVMRRTMKDPRSPAEKREAAQIKALEEAIDIYDQRLAAGDFSALYDKNDIPVTDRVKALRELRDTRRKVYMAAKKASRPVMTREERINSQRMAALNRREADLKARIANKNFSVKPKPLAVADDKLVAKRRFELDEEKAKFNKLLADYRFEQMGWFGKFGTLFVKTLNLSRAVITAVDLSAVLRQGGIAILAHPSMLKKGFMPMLRAFRSKQGAHTIDTELKNRANANLYKESGLFIADQNTADPSKMEEVYMSAWAEVIPVIAGSSRAYVTFLNKLRADMFDMMLATLTADGHTHTKEEALAIANYVNVATGRGKIGFKSFLQLKENSQAGEHLATIFFAPKYVASRFNFLLGQPMYAAPNSVRKMIAKEYARYFAGVSAVVSLAAMAAMAFRDDDDEREIISFDPRKSDFLKVKFGDTRIDLMSGLIQPSVFLARILSGQTKSRTGDAKALRNWWQLPTEDLDPYAGVSYGATETFGVMTTFGRSKLAPAPGALINFLSGSNVVGQQVEPGAEILSMFIPLSIRDFTEMVKENGVPGAIALQTIVTFGAGAQTYGDGGWSEMRGGIEKKIQEIKDEVTAEPDARARRKKFDELKKEYPWLLSGANLDSYKTSNRKTGIRRGDIKETGSGVKIKDLPEHIKGDTTELIGDLNSAIRKLQKKTKLEDFADLAEYSPTLKEALESGDIDTGQFLGIKIRKELEKEARRIKQENIAEIRRAKRVAN